MSRYVYFPEWWDELTPKQFHYFLERFCTKIMTDEWGVEEFKLDFTDYLLGREKYIRTSRIEAYNAMVYQLSESLTWLFDETKTPIEIRFDTTINIFAKLGKLEGPASHGSDMRFGEYRKCVALFEEFNNSDGDEMYLNLLTGSLYRKPGKTPEYRREEFSEYKVNEYGKAGSRFDFATKYGVYLWFMNFNRHLFSGEFVIDGKTICFSPIFGKSKKQTSGQDIGFSSILFTMADAGTFGNADETDQAPLFSVMLKLLHDKNQIDSLKKPTTT